MPALRDWVTSPQMKVGFQNGIYECLIWHRYEEYTFLTPALNYALLIVKC